MKKRFLWALLALLVVAAVIFLIALPNRAGNSTDDERAQELSQEMEKRSGDALPTDPSVPDGELPDADSADEMEDAAASPNIDPSTGMVLEEDELPIIAP